MTWSIFYYRFFSNQEGSFSWNIRYIEHTLFLPSTRWQSCPELLIIFLPVLVFHCQRCSLTCSVSLPVAFKCEWWVLSCFLDSDAEVFVYSIFIFWDTGQRHRGYEFFTCLFFSQLIQSVKIHYDYFQLDNFPTLLKRKIIPLHALVLVWFFVFSVSGLHAMYVSFPSAFCCPIGFQFIVQFTTL